MQLSYNRDDINLFGVVGFLCFDTKTFVFIFNIFSRFEWRFKRLVTNRDASACWKCWPPSNELTVRWKTYWIAPMSLGVVNCPKNQNAPVFLFSYGWILIQQKLKTFTHTHNLLLVCLLGDFLRIVPTGKSPWKTIIFGGLRVFYIFSKHPTGNSKFGMILPYFLQKFRYFSMDLPRMWDPPGPHLPIPFPYFKGLV